MPKSISQPGPSLNRFRAGFAPTPFTGDAASLSPKFRNYAGARPDIPGAGILGHAGLAPALYNLRVLHTLRISTRARSQALDITSEVEKLVRAANVASGICYLYVPHTTAGVVVNEHDDPDVMSDVHNTLGKLIPQRGEYKHYEGNSDSHIKATLAGSSQSVPIENGRLALGRWQGIFFCEFDGPRERQLRVKIIAG